MVAWTRFKPIFAAIDGPGKKRFGESEGGVGTVGRWPIPDRLDQRHHVGASNVGDRPFGPLADELAPYIPLCSSRRPALAAMQIGDERFSDRQESIFAPAQRLALLAF